MHRAFLLPMLIFIAVAASPHDASAQAIRGDFVEIDKTDFPEARPDDNVRRYVWRAGMIGHESQLLLCGVNQEWSAERNDHQQYDDLSDSFYCRIYDEQQSKRVKCDWNEHRPNEESYNYLPYSWKWNSSGGIWQLEQMYGSDKFFHTTGDAIYGLWDVSCKRNASSDISDTISHASSDGRFVIPAPDGDGFYDTVYAETHGGFVEHHRPAFARASARVRRSSHWHYDYTGDLTLAIQMLGDGGWTDVATRTFTTTKDLHTYFLEAQVPELTDVRVQVRGKYHRSLLERAMLEFQDVRIFVEQCVPDVSNPGECLK